MPESETLEGGSEFRRTPGKQLYDMTEHELVSEILFGSARLYKFFGFVMTDVHGLKAADGWEYVFLGNIPRTDLGLSRLGQPGDIDLLIIPHQGNKFHLGKAAAIEIKRSSITDMTGYISSERQLGRLLAHKPDPVIGLNCVSLCDVEQSTHRGVMVGMPNGRPAKRNPNASLRA